LAKIGFDEKYGARPIKRAIQEKIEDFISEEVLRQKLKIGNNYTMSVDGETVTLKGDE
jgi:ATP-dependent Clp protease ATP-binding subunit ClpC